MEKFTVKDFILYNGPCFSCGGPISFSVGYRDIAVDENTEGKLIESMLATKLYKDHIRVDLCIKYVDTLSLKVELKSNKFSTNNEERLKKYFKEYELYLYANCQGCYSYSMSKSLEFDMKGKFIKPVSILQELIDIVDDNNFYQILSTFLNNKSNIWISKIDQSDIQYEPLEIEAPLLLRSKFKTKDQLIKKLRTYMTFA